MTVPSSVAATAAATPALALRQVSGLEDGGQEF